ncbi:transglycosylase domain-containing protein [Albibacterium sp.]|uniref:transglycosylase domain-containing protein n=1 Tax=Albibacterium sp. TaxID=2952885 RepID=UPI002D802CDA|nr:transglycosylase domain-containing protein [Albibacterium sp.]
MFRRIKNKPLRYIVLFIYFFIILICAIEINFLNLFGYSPNKNDILMPDLNIASELYTADGKLLGKYFKENRNPVQYNEISEALLNTLVSTEDIRFFKHNGVDFIAVFTSLFSTVQGDRRGASTITQQLAKNLYQTRYDKSAGLLGKIPGVRLIVIKVKEWITAYKLETKYSKEDILTMYLNTVSFGNNNYGIKTAAKYYFNVVPDSLNVPQSALLIGMLKGTTLYNPIRNPENSKKRRNVVLSQMEKANFITKEELAKFQDLPINLSVNETNEDSSEDSYIRAAVLRFLNDWSKESGYNIYEDGLKIYTTIDSKMQTYAEEVVSNQMKTLQNRFNNVWGNDLPWRDSGGEIIDNFLENLAAKTPFYTFLKEKYKGNSDSINYYLNRKKEMEVFTWNGMKKVDYSTLDSIAHYAKMLNTGMMSMDPFTGEIKVWVGGINHKYYKFDHVDQAKRQAGSTFKPFAYLTAIEQGMAPCDIFIDKPVKISYTEDGKEMEWEPKNADWNFTYQNMSLRWAMGRSVNSITAQITEKVGWDKVVETAHRLGIKSPLKAVPSVSLGPNDVSVFEMVKAYSTFLNKGNSVDPILVSTIKDRNGNVIAEFKSKSKRVLSEENAWLMMYMLRGTMEEPGGTSQALWEWDLWKKGNQIAGKTGTSSDYVDGWYMGLTKDLVTGVWVGNDERSIHFKSSSTGEGAHTALPIFGKFMEKLYHDENSGYTYGPFPEPGVEITKTYYCPTPRPVQSNPTDSTAIEIDSIPFLDNIDMDKIIEESKQVLPSF